jgi:uncharacterized protein
LAAENVTLSGLYVYPIKSCAGIPLESADISATGLRHDRRWMLVDETGEFMSQRTHPRMALISVHLSTEYLIARAPGMPDLKIPIQQEHENQIDVRIWDDTNRGALVREEADRWFGEFLKVPCRLVYKPEDDLRIVDSHYAAEGDQVGFADGFAFLLISEASLEDLNERLEYPLPMNRFRPNFVVSGCLPYAEDGWSRLRIGNVPFRVAEPCPRCAITTVDQKSGVPGKEPLRTLATYRKSERGASSGVTPSTTPSRQFASTPRRVLSEPAGAVPEHRLAGALVYGHGTYRLRAGIDHLTPRWTFVSRLPQSAGLVQCAARELL